MEAYKKELLNQTVVFLKEAWYIFTISRMSVIL